MQLVFTNFLHGSQMHFHYEVDCVGNWMCKSHDHYLRVVRWGNVIMGQWLRHVLVHNCVGKVEYFKLLWHEDAGKSCNKQYYHRLHTKMKI
jgi:hypothetical protein